MKPIKVLIKLVDKDKIFTLKGKYDPETRIAIAKRKIFDKTPLKFQVDPTHIYFEGQRRVCFVDNATRTSRAVHSNEPIDQKTATTLNLLIDQAFWKGLMEKRKISAMTAFALILAGIGVYTLLVTMLRAVGINV